MFLTVYSVKNVLNNFFITMLCVGVLCVGCLVNAWQYYLYRFKTFKVESVEIIIYCVNGKIISVDTYYTV